MCKFGRCGYVCDIYFVVSVDGCVVMEDRGEESKEVRLLFRLPTLEIPKSHKKMVRFASKRIFSGLRSRCTIPTECRNSCHQDMHSCVCLMCGEGNGC